MWLLANMKFRHRVLATLTVLGLMTFSVYLSLPVQMDAMELNQMHRMMLRSANVSKVKHWSHTGLQMDSEMCSLTRSDAPHHCNISTYDLYHSTQFNVKSDGEWETSTPAAKHSRNSSRPRLTVLLVPHSHNDPGWQKTVNEYYVDQTRHILNNMVLKLTQYPKMTFIWAETIFFSMWWNEVEDAVKAQVRRLIRRRQLEITLGGWVMPDEASSEYTAVVDQLIEGHQWLWENLKVRPQNSWSIDPFGYSGTMPYLWKMAGMSNMVIQRVHQAVKSSLVNERALEFYWRQMWDGKGATDIFCHVMPFMLYNIMYTCGPNKFACSHFDFRKFPEGFPENLGEPITQDNLERSAEMLFHEYRAKADYFRYNTILVPVGDDFRYDKEDEWDQQYGNYEMLMKYMHSRADWNVRVRWATLRDYFWAINKEHRTQKLLNNSDQFPVLSGDFFPYSDRNMEYWTGYFSTRPFDKFFGREVHATLRAADVLNTFQYALNTQSGMFANASFSSQASLLRKARRSLGLFLHHDAITGTSKEFVAEDYEQYLLKALVQSQEVIKSTLQSLLSNGLVNSPMIFQAETGRRTHTSLPEKQVISVLQSGTTVAVFNPLAQARQQIIRLLVNTHILEVVTSSRRIVPSQVGWVWSSGKDAAVLDDVFELTFVVEIGPFAIASYILYKRTTPPDTLYSSLVSAINYDKLNTPGPSPSRPKKSEPPIKVNNKVIELTFDPRTGSLLNVKDLATGKLTQLGLGFHAYTSRGSGAYLFSPKESASNFTQVNPAIRIMRGPLTTTVTVTYGMYLTHTVTLHHYPSHLASAIFVENTLNIENFPDKEVIMRLSTDIRNTDLTYFTDQNGFQLIRRRTNKSLPTQANYYPVTSAVLLEDHESRLTLLTAQPHGAACLQAGQLEVMLDRHILSDDNRGMGEGVKDIKTTTSKFVVVVERRTSSAPPSPKHFTSLSLASLVVSDLLQQPLLAYFTTVETAMFHRDLDLFPQPLPCAITVANFRSLVDGNLNYNGTSLIFHRRDHDCSFPAVDLPCSNLDSTMTFKELFKDFSVSRIKKGTITHTINKGPVAPTDQISIAPMELAAFHFNF